MMDNSSSVHVVVTVCPATYPPLTAAGAGHGVYQLSKAVVVPVGYELGSGIVLSYETLSQVSAHAILAVSDCA